MASAVLLPACTAQMDTVDPAGVADRERVVDMEAQASCLASRGSATVVELCRRIVFEAILPLTDESSGAGSRDVFRYMSNHNSRALINRTRHRPPTPTWHTHS